MPPGVMSGRIRLTVAPWGRPVAPLKHTGRTLAGRSRSPLVARYPAVVRGGTVAQNPCTTASMTYRPTMS
jgi:hypothetical protein